MRELKEETVAALKAQAERKMWSEYAEFNPYDQSGGNYDDAYFGGREDGETAGAREILRELGVEFTIESED